MQLTFKEIVESRQALQALLSLSPAPTGRVAYAIARNARKINAALSDFAAAEKAIADEYAEDEGEARHVPEERQDAYVAEREELLAQTVDVDIRVITEADIRACDEKRRGFALPPDALYLAWFMFEDGEDNDEPADESGV